MNEIKIAVLIIGAIVIALLIGVTTNKPTTDGKLTVYQNNNESFEKGKNITGEKINETKINISENYKTKKYTYRNTLSNYTAVYIKSISDGYVVIEAEDNPKKEEFEFRKYAGAWMPNIKCPPCESTDISEYLNRTLVIDQKTNNIKIINIPWLRLFKMQNNIIYKKLIPPTGEGKFEENYIFFNYNNCSGDIKWIINIEDLIFSFNILYFQNVDVEKLNVSGIKTQKLIKTECKDEGEEQICDVNVGCNNYTMYNCTSFYNVTYNLTCEKGINNKKTVSESQIEQNKCRPGVPKKQENANINQSSLSCYDAFSNLDHFKMYFAGTENFNGKTAYKIIYEKFINISEVTTWHVVDTFLVDKEEGILIKATSKNNYVDFGVSEEPITSQEIVLEKEEF